MFNVKYIETYELMYNKQWDKAFLVFSDWLEVFKRILCCDKFIELSNFPLFEFKFDKQGRLSVIGNEFEEREQNFKFAREFNSIRIRNYINRYGKNGNVKARGMR